MPRSRKKKKTTRPSSPDHVRWILLTLGLVLVTSCAAFAAAYDDRFLPGTRIGNVSVGGLTVSAAEQRLRHQLGQQQVNLVYQQRSWTPSWSELGLTFDTIPALSEAFALGRSAPLRAWFDHLLLGRPVALSYTWSNDALQQYLSRVIDTIGDPPRDPQVIFVNGQFQVSQERSGLVINDDELQNALRPAALAGGSTSLALEPTIQWPLAHQADFSKAIPAAQTLIAKPLVVTSAGQTYTVDSATLASWLNFAIVGQNEIEVQVNTSAIGAWLLTIAKDVNIAPEPKQLLASVNRTDELSAGRDGREVDVAAAVKLLEQAILRQTSTVDVPVNPVPATTTFASVPTAPVTTGKVITVDISRQHEYVYEDGVLVYHSKVSTGLNDWTPTGTFKIYAKTKRQKMSGPDYYVPNVPHILWFSGDYSIHGVYWHNDFGIRPRSHGCVGMPLDAAAWLYDWAEVGTAVIIYKSSQAA